MLALLRAQHRFWQTSARDWPHRYRRRKNCAERLVELDNQLIDMHGRPGKIEKTMV
jgi:hypothetical protein